jgi:predicted GNAT superfamily acetyltransferase
VNIVELTDPAQLHDAADLFDRIWRVGGDERVFDPSTLRALAHTGNYVAGVYDGSTLVGASVGFFAADGHLHSHITGIVPDAQSHGIGRALKFHQRDWALARGRNRISWTFDPLIARNAYFNLHVLGARAVEYLPDFYGAMDDGINAGDATDRIYVEWPLDASAPPAPSGLDVPALLDRDSDRPRPGRLADPACTVATPHDAEQLRADRPELSIRWRMAVREAMTTALAQGYRIGGITRDGRYLLENR